MTQGCNEGGRGAGGASTNVGYSKTAVSSVSKYQCYVIGTRKLPMRRRRSPVLLFRGKHCIVVAKNLTILSAVNSVHFTLIFVHNALFQ